MFGGAQAIADGLDLEDVLAGRHGLKDEAALGVRTGFEIRAEQTRADASQRFAVTRVDHSTRDAGAGLGGEGYRQERKSSEADGAHI